MSGGVDGDADGAEVPALQVAAPERGISGRFDLRRKRTAALLLAAACVVVFAAGVLAGWIHRHDTICSDGKAPVAQRSDLLGNTEFRCPNGQTVTVSS
jgi:hypothetical protein